MDIFKNMNKKFLFLPAIISFLITLILVYKFTFPISWDVYYHIHMADLYMGQGLIFWDYQTVAPYGRLIMYPPLFHLVLGYIAIFSGLSLVDVARFSQPFLAFLLIFSITYSTYILTNKKIAFITGFLGLFSFVTFNRAVICTPATIAISLFMISSVLFFVGFKNNDIYKIIISALSLGLIANLHMATLMLTVGVLSLYTLIQISRHKINFKYLLIFIFISLIIALPWWLYIYLNYGLYFKSLGGSSLLLTNFFFKYYGIIPTVLTIFGFYKLLKNKSEKSLFLIVWSLSLVLLSQVTYLGITTVSIRILEIAAYPLIIIAGIGFGYIYDHIKSFKIKNILIILLIIFSVLSSIIYVDSYTPDIMASGDKNTTLIDENIHFIIDPVGTYYKPSIISSRYGNSTLASDRYEVMQWFINNTNKSLLVSEDSILDTIIVSTSQTPVVYGGFTESIPEYVVDPVHIIHNQSTKSEIHDLNIGYILLRKNTKIPWYANEVYHNSNYKICEININ